MVGFLRRERARSNGRKLHGASLQASGAGGRISERGSPDCEAGGRPRVTPQENATASWGKSTTQ